MTKRVVALFGTFDLFHPGHLDVLMQAKALGDNLVVIVARDETCKSIKGEYPVHDEKERLALLDHIDVVDRAVLGDMKLESYEVLRDLGPYVIDIGYDQDALEQSIKNAGIDIPIHRLKAYKQKDHKSGVIRKKLKANGI